MHDSTRIAHFSDGVFAVAITLLVLDLRVPATANGSLIGALADQWPQFAAFAVSFVLVGCIWVNHHEVFKTVTYVDRPLLFLNLAFLLTIVVIPFSTSLFAEYVVSGGSQAGTAGALFNGSMLLMGLSFRAVIGRAHRGQPHPARAKGFGAVIESLPLAVGPVVYATCIGLSFVSAPVVLILDAALAAYYVFGDVIAREPAA